MKLSNLSKTVGATVLCLSLNLPSNLPAFAQATSPDATGDNWKHRRPKQLAMKQVTVTLIGAG